MMQNSIKFIFVKVTTSTSAFSARDISDSVERGPPRSPRWRQLLPPASVPAKAKWSWSRCTALTPGHLIAIFPLRSPPGLADACRRPGRVEPSSSSPRIPPYVSLGQPARCTHTSKHTYAIKT